MNEIFGYKCLNFKISNWQPKDIEKEEKLKESKKERNNKMTVEINEREVKTLRNQWN